MSTVVGSNPSAGAVLARAVQLLGPLSDSARADAEVLLSTVLGLSRGQLLARPDAPLSDAQCTRFEALLARRAGAEPVAYLLEAREFWSLPLRVTPAVLIPRPETERLVECALACVADVVAPRVLDLGTGSGAIALALAHARPDAQVTAIERSAAALAVARDNGRRIAPKRVRWRLGSWFEPLDVSECFDLIVSNPPYVRRGDPALSAAVAAHEPAEALYADDDGMAALAAIARAAPVFLAPGGQLLMEHGPDQQPRVCELLTAAGFADVRGWVDLGGRPRVSGGRCGEARR